MTSNPDFRPYRRFPFLPEPNAFYRWWVGLVGSGKFQRFASSNIFTRGAAKRDGEKLFDLVAGFVHSQVLSAFVRLDLAQVLKDEPLPTWKIAARIGLEIRQTEVLCQAASALGLLQRRADGGYGLGRLGAAVPGVPGLAQMIAHHDVLYRDLEDPVQFFKAEGETELARFWPYVFGTQRANDPEAAETYSKLMSDSQGLVADETLRALSLQGVSKLMDLGGGTGAFLRAVAVKNPDIALTLFDLPTVVAKADVPADTRIIAGSFREDTLPGDLDAVSLVRVLYDHSDTTVKGLLRKIYTALPPGGRLIVSEPMAGGDRPTRVGDGYFAIYTLAMQTGRTRSIQEVSDHLTLAGFENITHVRTYRPFVTSVVTASKPH